jgi:beta-lactamase regulating signal transducer with metallopeptidase domain
MSFVLQHPYAQALAWALVHFLWQGAAIALVLVAVHRLGRLSASARYTTGVVAMVLMLGMPVLTVVRLSSTPPTMPSAGAVVPEGAIGGISDRAADASPVTPLRQDVPPPEPSSVSLLPTAVLVAWSAGVIALSLRLLGGWIVARRFARRALSPASAEIQALARRVAGRLALDRVVGVFESASVSVPMMIGWIKPVVLLPTAAVAGLSMAQVEALLAHELAHVRRHDYLVNLLQSVVETLLFYHPAVWFVSRRMRVDREHCCDDLAVDVCDRVVYATALTELASIARTPRMALAATDGSLVNRVRRILGQNTDRTDAGSGWLSACLVVVLVISGAVIAPIALKTSAQTSQTTSDPTAVVGGVVAGVSAGVPGGVATGVKGGPVKSAVVGGVQGGVVGGVPGGVSAGVGGVAGWLNAPAQAAAQAQQAQQARDEELKALEARRRQLEEERAKIEAARAENELRRAETQGRTRMQQLELELNRLMQDHARMRQQVANGAATSSSVAEVEAKIAVAQNQLAAEKSEMEFRKMEFELRRRELDLERQALRTDREREEAVRRLSHEADLTSIEAERHALMRRVEEAVKQSEAEAARLSFGEAADRVKLELSTAVLEPNATAAAGDYVFVAIHNEPDLPRMFVVQKDGTIRFPFLGAIRVEGQTARQVRDALSKQLADRKLATGSGIDVTLRRR